MFRGIDNDEAVFLEFASKQQAEIDGRRYAVTAEVKEFRVSFFLTSTCNDDQGRIFIFWFGGGVGWENIEGGGGGGAFSGFHSGVWG